MHVDVARISIEWQHNPPIWTIKYHRHFMNSLAKNSNKLYPCNIGHVGTWCHNECGAYWVNLSVKVF